MKFSLLKSLFVAMALMVIGSVSAQQVTLDDLMSEQQETKAGSKKWIEEFTASSDAVAAKEILRNELVKLEKSKHWIALYSGGEMTADFSFQTSKRMYLDKVLKDLKAAGFTLANSKIETDSRTYTYTKSGVTVEILAITSEATADSVYMITLL